MNRKCLDCDSILHHHAAKRCTVCAPIFTKKNQKEYREKNREACSKRSRLSYFKREEYYLEKRRYYYRKKNNLPDDWISSKKKSGEGNIDAQGYKTITKRGHPNQMDDRGRIREHVFVMSEHLKRPLIKGESVHHKNGDRLDNRIEHLELWNIGQPAGQRVDDKIKFYIEFLTMYGYKVTKD